MISLLSYGPNQLMDGQLISITRTGSLFGEQVCARIKADQETYLTPVILVTALSAREDRVAGINLRRG
jgi:DNA-binding response OmpR family regulator